MKGIYHSRDLDGWCSGAIMKMKYPNIDLIGWDYGDQIPVIENEQIIMSDISFPPQEMIKLAENNLMLLWIDHHKSAIKDFEDYFRATRNTAPGNLFVNLDPTYAACELTWKHLMDEKMPSIVELLGMYDSFRHKGTKDEEVVMNFQYGARAYISNPEECLDYLETWDYDDEQEFIDAGYAIYKYLKVMANDTYLKRSWDMEFDGLKFRVANEQRFNPSSMGIDYHADGYDGFACYWDTENKRHWSLYSGNGKTDCSVIAKKRGGGGHFGAAGFTETIQR